MKNDLNPLWQPFDVSLATLCGGGGHDGPGSRGEGQERALHLEVYDYENGGDHRLLGQCTTSVAQLLALRKAAESGACQDRRHHPHLQPHNALAPSVNSFLVTRTHPRSLFCRTGAGDGSISLEWPPDILLEKKALKAKQKAKGKEGSAGSLIFDAFSFLPAAEGATRHTTTSATVTDEVAKLMVSVECRELPNMDTFSKTDPMAVVYYQDTRPAQLKREESFIGKLHARTKQANARASVAQILQAKAQHEHGGGSPS